MRGTRAHRIPYRLVLASRDKDWLLASGAQKREGSEKKVVEGAGCIRRAKKAYHPGSFSHELGKVLMMSADSLALTTLCCGIQFVFWKQKGTGGEKSAQKATQKQKGWAKGQKAYRALSTVYLIACSAFENGQDVIDCAWHSTVQGHVCSCLRGVVSVPRPCFPSLSVLFVHDDLSFPLDRGDSHCQNWVHSTAPGREGHAVKTWRAGVMYHLHCISWSFLNGRMNWGDVGPRIGDLSGRYIYLANRQLRHVSMVLGFEIQEACQQSSIVRLLTER